jgi:HPt (histidine-containing phosphotransfer) domain-containing protein
MQDLDNDLKIMREALQNKDYIFIEKISHNIKGVSGGYGFDELSKMAGLLEEMAKEKESTAIKETLNKISHYLKHVEVNYSK